MTEATTRNSAARKSEGGVLELVWIVVQALLIALVVRTLLFQPFNIPSGSLVPTLLVGDYLFVSKYSYGYSKYSLPLGLPLFEGRIMASEPKRGDIAVFKLPKDGKTDYIKRVIGLPGDRIQMIDARLYINGQETQRDAAAALSHDRRLRPPRRTSLITWRPCRTASRMRSSRRTAIRDIGATRPSTRCRRALLHDGR